MASTALKALIDEMKGLVDLGRVHVPVRQTVLNGHVGIDGYADFIQQGTGLNVNLLGATTPVTITFAYNFDTFGQVDYVATISSDITNAWSGLPTNSTCYLYVDRNISTGGLSYGYSLLAPTYVTIAPSSPSTDQHWFDLNSFYMKRWAGTAWEIKQRVFVGEAVTGASSIMNVITYALKRRFISRWMAVAATQNYTFNHNLGISIPDLGIAPAFYFSLDSSGNDSYYAHDIYLHTDANTVGHSVRTIAANSRNTICFGFGAYVQMYLNTLRTSGYYRVALSSTW
jgi:hypothetical protein